MNESKNLNLVGVEGVQNPFRNGAMRSQFDVCVSAFLAKGRAFTGNSMANNFWRGYDGAVGYEWDSNSRATVAYAHYRAGKACATLAQQPATVESLPGNWEARARGEQRESVNKEWDRWVRENHAGAAHAYLTCAKQLREALTQQPSATSVPVGTENVAADTRPTQAYLHRIEYAGGITKAKVTFSPKWPFGDAEAGPGSILTAELVFRGNPTTAAQPVVDEVVASLRNAALLYEDGSCARSNLTTAALLVERLAQQPAPVAPVGVEGLNAAAVEAGHITFESMKQCADSWLAVVDALNTSAPGWCEKKGTGRECAVAAIVALAQQPAAVDEEDYIFALQELADNEGSETFINSTDAAALRVAIKALAQQPAPSVPVGVEGIANEIENYHWDVADWGKAAEFAERLRALAQQPAAVDGANRSRYMQKLWLDEWLFDHEIELASDAYVELLDALAGQPGGSDNG